MAQTIVPIVEGQGDVKAAPALIRRVLHEDLGEYQFQVAPAKRLKRTRIRSDLSKVLEYAAKESEAGAIIVIVDADNDCAQELARKMSRISVQRNIGLPVGIVCPKTEYESWFIASIDDIKAQAVGQRGFVIDSAAHCPNNVEAISDPKKWLSDRMRTNMAYKPTQDQTPLTHKMNLQRVKARSRSFRRLCHAVEEVVAGIRAGSTTVTP